MPDRALSIKESTLVSIADTIRTKTSDTNLIQLTEFAEKILSISGENPPWLVKHGIQTITTDSTTNIWCTTDLTAFPDFIMYWYIGNRNERRTHGGILFPTIGSIKVGMITNYQATSAVISGSYDTIDVQTSASYFRMKPRTADYPLLSGDYYWVCISGLFPQFNSSTLQAMALNKISREVNLYE